MVSISNRPQNLTQAPRTPRRRQQGGRGPHCGMQSQMAMQVEKDRSSAHRRPGGPAKGFPQAPRHWHFEIFDSQAHVGRALRGPTRI